MNNIDQNQINIDNDNEIVTIDYFDYINNKWIKVDVTKKVAKFLEADDRNIRRKQAQYNYRNISYHKVFNENRPRKINKLIIDIKQEPDFRLNYQTELLKQEANYEHKKVLIENALDTLTDNQRRIVVMRMKNMSYKEIMEVKKVKSLNSVYKPLHVAYKKIKYHIKENEN